MPTFQPDPSSTPDSQSRELRTNLFVAAVVRHGGASSAVRVRNLSPLGAMIESDAMLSPGEEIRLERGSLASDGQVRWVAGKRAGLNFGYPLSVPEWLASARGTQVRVEQALTLVRQNAPMASIRREHHSVTAADLTLAKELVDQLAEVLALTPGLTAELGREMQSLDILSQLLTSLGALAGGNSVALDSLRASARAALGRDA